MNINRHRTRPHGFTLLEVLVVIAIIGVLLALILPAVQAAREAARRTRCQNNLRQMGLALTNYHDALGSFPMGYVSRPGLGQSPLSTSPGWGWAALTLPQLDQGPLYDATNFDLPIENAANFTARTTAVGVFACPSDRDVGRYTAVRIDGAAVAEVHTNSYAACFGAGQEIDAFPDRGNGMFVRDRVTRLADVLDGTSQTIAVGERGACLVMTPWAGTPAGAVSTFTPGSTAASYDSVGRGAELVVAHADGTPPNGHGTGPDDFYSPHAAGIHFLFADGSVRLVKPSVSLPVYRALCTKDLGELLDAGAY